MVNEPMHIIDWYPTLVKLAGGSLEQKLPPDGKDLWPTLTNGAKSPHDALLICGHTPGEAAVRAGDWKLIHSQKPKRKGTKTARDEYQLFNLATDIGEKENLADKNPEKLAEMKQTLQHLLKDAVPSGESKADR